MSERMDIVVSAEDRSAAAFNSLRANMRNLAQEMRKAEADMRQALTGGVEQMRRANAPEQLRQTTAAARATRAEMINLSRQVQDIGVSIASGQSPFMVLVQQGTQVADIFASSTQGAGGLMRSIGALLTPTRLLVGGVAGLAAAAYIALGIWRNFALTLDDLSRSAGVSASQMLKLQQLAAIKGVGENDFAAGMRAFAGQVYFAKDGLGQLAELLRANGLRARDFEQAFLRVADLVRRAPDDMTRLQILQRAGLPATMDFVRLMSQGGDNIKRAMAELQGVNAGFYDLVAKERAFDEAWNRGWTKFKIYAKLAIGEAASGIGDLLPSFGSETVQRRGTSGAMRRGLRGQAGDVGMSPQSRINDVFGVVGANPLGQFKPGQTTVDPNVIRQQLGLEQQRIGVLGQLAGVADLVRQKEIEINLARLAGVSISKEQEAALLKLARFQAESARFQEKLALGIFSEAEARRLADAEIDLAKRRGLIKTLEDEAAARAVVKKRIEEQAIAAAVAKSPFEQLTRLAKESQRLDKQLDQALASGLNSFTDGFADFILGAKSAQEAFKSFADSVIRDLARIAIRQAIVGPLAQALVGGLGGFFAPTKHSGGMVGPGGPGRYVHPLHFNDAPRFHSGGVVGKERPIIAMDGEEVGWPKDLARKYGGAGDVKVEVFNVGGGPSPQVTSRRGPDGRQLVRVVVGEIKQAMARGEFRDVGIRPGVGRQ